MAGRGKTLESDASKKAQSRNSKVGLQFSVGRIDCFIQAGKHAKHVGAGAPIYLSMVLKYFTTENLAGNTARNSRRTRMVPRYIQLTLKNQVECSNLLVDITTANGRVLPKIHNLLVPKKTGGSSQLLANED